MKNKVIILNNEILIYQFFDVIIPIAKNSKEILIEQDEVSFIYEIKH